MVLCRKLCIRLANRQGLEPRTAVLETAVLPIKLSTRMEQEARIELALTTWKDAVLPLNYSCITFFKLLGNDPYRHSGSVCMKMAVMKPPTCTLALNKL